MGNIDWPTVLSAASDLAQIVALVVGGAWALNRFGITRASRTFLEMSVGAIVVGGDEENALVEVVVRLKNIGASRIDARRGSQPGAFLYDDGWDKCEHAGTLKVRAVPTRSSPLVFDWYGLQPLTATLMLTAHTATSASGVAPSGALEQINYLADFQDPIGGFADVDFWLEPNETYELKVPLWLPPGHYAMKAYFLGKERGRGEEEYWSHTVFCRVEAPRRL